VVKKVIDWNLADYYQPHKKQQFGHAIKATQLLYGGAAGGGKSAFLRADAITFCLQNPGCQAFLFRRTFGELDTNHIVHLRRMFPKEIANWNEGRKALEFLNGSSLRCCYCEIEQDLDIYQGAEMHWLGVDEAALFTPAMLIFLRTRVRLGNWQPAEESAQHLPRIAYASNPGGPAHDFLKQIFIAHGPFRLFHDETSKNPKNPDSKGLLSIYIPSRMDDNPYIDMDVYAGQFYALGEQRARAFIEGDWDAIEGAALHNLTRERHMIRPFRIPAHWPIICGLDWGMATPYSVGWYTVSEGATIRNAQPHVGKDRDIYIPSGALIRFAEMYGWNGKPNQGQRLDSATIARKILDFEAANHIRVERRVADAAMWAASDGPSPLTKMVEASGGRLMFHKGRKDRQANYHEILSRLAGTPHYTQTGTIEDDPMLFVTSNCEHFWRTCPNLVLDKTSPDKGWEDKHQEDHVADELAYVCSVNPYIRTIEDYHDDLYRAHREAKQSNVDPYATHSQAA
jgi:hypothetical protein